MSEITPIIDLDAINYAYENGIEIEWLGAHTEEEKQAITSVIFDLKNRNWKLCIDSHDGMDVMSEDSLFWDAPAKWRLSLEEDDYLSFIALHFGDDVYFTLNVKEIDALSVAFFSNPLTDRQRKVAAIFWGEHRMTSEKGDSHE